MTWEIPAPLGICELCGHDMSAHTGPCILVETLKEALGKGDGSAEATVNGVRMHVEQCVMPGETMPTMWTYYDPDVPPPEDITTLWDVVEFTFDDECLEAELFDLGYDPEALIWQRL